MKTINFFSVLNQFLNQLFCLFFQKKKTKQMSYHRPNLVSVIVYDEAKIKIPVFRVTRLYLKLLVKPRIFFRFSGIYILFYAFLKGKNAFQNA